jgi:hypothetical protein
MSLPCCAARLRDNCDRVSRERKIVVPRERGGGLDVRSSTALRCLTASAIGQPCSNMSFNSCVVPLSWVGGSLRRCERGLNAFARLELSGERIRVKFRGGPPTPTICSHVRGVLDLALRDAMIEVVQRPALVAEAQSRGCHRSTDCGLSTIVN